MIHNENNQKKLEFFQWEKLRLLEWEERERERQEKKRTARLWTEKIGDSASDSRLVLEYLSDIIFNNITPNVWYWFMESNNSKHVHTLCVRCIRINLQVVIRIKGGGTNGNGQLYMYYYCMPFFLLQIMQNECVQLEKHLQQQLRQEVLCVLACTSSLVSIKTTGGI